MHAKSFTVEQLLNDPKFLRHLDRAWTFTDKKGQATRTPEQRKDDRDWGDIGEKAFALMTGLDEHPDRYQDFEGFCELDGVQLTGITEVKVLRPEQEYAMATFICRNYIEKQISINSARANPEERYMADNFFFWHGDRQTGILTPAYIYQRAFANGIELVKDYT